MPSCKPRSRKHLSKPENALERQSTVTQECQKVGFVVAREPSTNKHLGGDDEMYLRVEHVNYCCVKVKVCPRAETTEKSRVRRWVSCYFMLSSGLSAWHQYQRCYRCTDVWPSPLCCCSGLVVCPGDNDMPLVFQCRCQMSTAWLYSYQLTHDEVLFGIAWTPVFAHTHAVQLRQLQASVHRSPWPDFPCYHPSRLWSGCAVSARSFPASIGSKAQFNRLNARAKPRSRGGTGGASHFLWSTHRHASAANKCGA